MTTLGAFLMNGSLLSALLVVSLREVAPRFGFVDRPAARKSHEGAIPLCGGLAMFMAYLVTMLQMDASFRPSWGFMAGITTLVIMGAADDRLNLSAVLRLVVQVAVAIGFILADGRVIGSLGLPLSFNIAETPAMQGAFAVLTVVFVVGLINAFNMIDGLDGLAGGCAAAALFWLAMAAIILGRGADKVQLLLLLAVVLGFLAFNMRYPTRSRALVFIGDAGSMMLGGAIAYFIIGFSAGPGPAIPFVVLLWVCIVPVVDTLSLIVRRVAAGRSPFSADRWHLHHLLIDSGYSYERTVSIIVGLAILGGAIACLGLAVGVPEPALAAALVLPFAAHIAFVRYAMRHRLASHPQPEQGAVAYK